MFLVKHSFSDYNGLNITEVESGPFFDRDVAERFLFQTLISLGSAYRGGSVFINEAPVSGDK